MVIRVLLSLLFFGINISVFANERPELAVANINKSLLLDADAVVRYSSETYSVKNGEVQITEHTIITLLNEDAPDYLKYIVVYYDEDSKVNDMEAVLYDENGEEVKKLRNKDIEDIAHSDGFSLFNDLRLKYASFDYNSYPYTIEFTTVKTENQTFLFPYWNPLYYENVAVEESHFKVRFPSGQNVTYQENMQGVKVERSETTTQLSWSIEDTKAFPKEIYGPATINQLPTVKVNLGGVTYGKYEGDLSSWKSMGAFFSRLNKDRDEVPAAVINEVKVLVEGLDSVEEKARVIYKYLQDNTRYVSVQLGIGGYQTFPAEYVANNGYGDCKALSNYMQSLLKVVGIPSHYVIIQNDPKPIALSETFVENRFNHIILAIPNGQDTIWLENTSQQIPFGFIGKNNMNRKVLLVDDNGNSKLVSTPKFHPKDHVIKTKAKVKVLEGGNAEINSEMTRTGYHHSRYRGVVDYSDNEIKEFFENVVPVSTTFSMNDYSIEVDEDEPVAVLSYDGTARKAVKVTSSRMFITPSFLTGIRASLEEDADRRQPLVLQTAFTEQIFVEFEVPEGYTAEALPEPKVLNTPFGNYNAEFSYVDGVLSYKSTLVRNSGTFDKSMYNDYVAFRKEIYNTERQKAVLKKE